MSFDVIKEHNAEERCDHMTYMDDMEQIPHEILDKVVAEINSYRAEDYTASDVIRAIESDRCSLEDFKALLSPAAEPFLEQIARKARLETRKHFGNSAYSSRLYTFLTTVRTTAFTVVSTAITKSKEQSFPWRKSMRK